MNYEKKLKQIQTFRKYLTENKHLKDTEVYIVSKMELSNLIYDIKEKLTDNEYKTIMEKIKEKRDNEKILCKVEVIVPYAIMMNDCGCEEINLRMRKYNRIMELTQNAYENIMENLPYSTRCKLDDIIEPISYIHTEHYCNGCDEPVKDNVRFNVDEIIILKCEKYQ